MRFVSLAVCVIAASLCGQNSAEAEQVTSSGTGFMVNRDGWLLTNAHVVEGCSRVAVGSLGDAKEILRDAANDLAAIRVQATAVPNFLSIRDTSAKLGEDVAALGFPLSDILSDGVKITTGNVNSLVGLENDTRYLQVSTPIQPGNSGGPLIDRRGLVLGINTAQLGAKYVSKTGVLPQNVNFAVKTVSLEVFLQSHSIAYDKKGEGEPKLETEGLASKVAPAVFQLLCYGQSEQAAAPVIAAPSNSPEPQPYVEPSDFLRLSGSDVIGFDYATLKNVSADQCRAACEQDRACIATTFNVKARFCFLKNDALVVVKNKNADASVHRSKEASIIRAPITIYSGRDMAGGDYREIPAAGFVGCVVECIRDRSCRAFSYIRKSSACWLKNQTGRAIKKSGIDLGVVE